MRIFKRIVLAIEILCAIGVVLCVAHIFLGGGPKAKDALSALNLDLPEYEITAEHHPHYRVGSRWDWYQYTLSFSTQDTCSLIEDLKSQGWYKMKDEYFQEGQGAAGFTYSAHYLGHVNPSRGTANLEVCVDVEYFFVIIVLLVIFSIFVGVIYGTVILIAKLITRYRQHKLRQEGKTDSCDDEPLTPNDKEEERQ